jgi:STE24 endopeptidase
MYVVVIVGFMMAGFAREMVSWRAAAGQAAIGTSAMTVLPAATASAVLVYSDVLRRRAMRAQANPDTTRRALARLAWRAPMLVSGVTLAAYAASLFLFGWASMPDSLGLGRWSSASGAVIVAPFVLSLLFAWIPLHYLDAAARPRGPTLAQRLSFNLRQYVLTVLVPVSAILLMYDAAALLPESVTRRIGGRWAQELAGLVVVLAGYTLAPVVIVRLWKTQTMPPSPIRSRLTELCVRLAVRFRDIRIWETPGHYIVNAAVMGIAGFVRYIVVSRTLLDVMTPDEVEAVFAHELGHARRRHMLYYLLFAGDFILLFNLFEVFAGGLYAAAEDSSGAAVAAYAGMAAAFGLYWGIGFGILSRTLERESDLYAADVIGDYRPFAGALLAIAHLNGISPTARAWRHGSIAGRVAFLEAAAVSLDVRRRFRDRAALVKAFIVAVALVSSAVLALAAAR